jgi:flagellar capping protein FliD
MFASFLPAMVLRVGFIPTIRREVSNLTNSAFGSIHNRKQALEGKIKRHDDQIANKQKHLDRREQQLRRQFGNLEETIGR